MSSGTEHTWQLPPAPAAVPAARRHVDGVCHGMPERQVEVARLLVSELVTNALQHGHGCVVLVVDRDDAGLRVEVHDESTAMPVLAEASSLTERGWGLRMVAMLARSWGVSPRHDGEPGKRVWFVLP